MMVSMESEDAGREAILMAWVKASFKGMGSQYFWDGERGE
jgi:hypothetical protein